MIDWLSAKHQVTEFHSRHGGECYDDGTGHLIYPDGAVRSVEGSMFEPPVAQDPARAEFDAASRKLTFFKVKLAAAVRQFDDLHEKLTYCQPNDEEPALKELEDLRAIVEARQEEVRQAQAVLDATSIGKSRKDALNRPQADRARTSNWRARLKAVRI